MNSEARLMLGQLLAAGFDGPAIPPEFERLVRQYKVGSVILFKRNVESFEQLRALCGDLRALIEGETGHAPIIMAGEEGGSVSRVAHIAAQTPCPMAVGATGDRRNARILGKIAGEELRAVGIGMALGPVLDCCVNPDNRVIGNRSFGADPGRVSQFGVEYMLGVWEAGVLCCGKHFPGHGDTAADSHLALPVINKSEAAFRKTDLPPFAAAIENGIDAIMTAHVALPALEPGCVPATVSRRIITGLLREELGFRGLILTDGMEMKAVMDLYGIEEATRRALAAGCDMALVCHSTRQAASVMEHLERALEEGTLEMEAVREHLSRVLRLKEKLKPPQGDQGNFGSESQKAAARRIMRQSLRLLNAPEGMALPRLGKSTLFLGLPARPASIAGDETNVNAAERFAEFFGGRHYDMMPGPDALGSAANAVVFLSPHPRMDSLVHIADALAQQGLPVIAVSLDTPRCLDQLHNIVWKIAAWQYDDLSVNALIEFLK